MNKIIMRCLYFTKTFSSKKLLPRCNSIRLGLFWDVIMKKTKGGCAPKYSGFQSLSPVFFENKQVFGLGPDT